jgi:hypothetical protein
MKKKGFAVLAVLALVMGAFGAAHALTGYWTTFKSTYSTSPLTQPPMTDASGRNCLVCHTGWPATSPSVSTVNTFGDAYANNGYVFNATLNGLDSDGDSYSNITEIQAGTYPGNSASHPSPADTTAPTVTSFTVPATATALTVSVSMAATDAVGVTGYMITETSTAPLASATNWSPTALSSYTFTTAGARTVYGWAKDAAGNVSAPVSRSITITLPDTTAPTVTNFTVPATATALTVSVSMAATDNVAVTGYIVTSTSTAPLASAIGWTSTPPTSFTFSSAGIKNIYGWAKDAAGNVSAPATSIVTITLSDTTAPTMTNFTVPATAAALTVSVSMAATDNVAVTGYIVTSTSTAPLASATGWTSTPPTSFTFSSAGTKTVYGWAKDAAGNVSASLSATVVIAKADITPPMVTSLIVPGSSGSLTVTASMAATDDAGVTGYMITETSTAPLASATNWSALSPTSYTFSSAGTKTVYGWAKDAAGNVSASLSQTVIIAVSDATRPVITGLVVSPRSSSLTVAITLTATDNVGVVGYFVSGSSTQPDLTAPGWTPTAPTSYTFGSAGYKTLNAWVKDAGGNISVRASRTVAVRYSGLRGEDESSHRSRDTDD